MPLGVKQLVFVANGQGVPEPLVKGDQVEIQAQTHDAAEDRMRMNLPDMSLYFRYIRLMIRMWPILWSLRLMRAIRYRDRLF